MGMGGQVFFFFLILGEESSSIEDSSCYCQILVLLDHVWRQHFRELVVLETTPKEFLFS